jgi:CubicO group peptidase (beta-lactamase class C family)
VRSRRLLTLTLAMLLCAAPAAAGEQPPDKRGGDRAGVLSGLTGDGPLLGFDHPDRTLRDGSPQQAGLVPEHLAALPAALRAYLQPSPDHPMYAGGVALAARHGVAATQTAAGDAVRYADTDTELSPGDRVPARRDTIYDLASVTKTFTTIAVMQQVEDGRVDLDEPVATYLPAFAQNGKGRVTVRNLLTHTGGLPAWLPLYSQYDTVRERYAAVLAAKPTSPPGTAYVYSDLGLITLGLLVEKVTGRSLDDVVTRDITAPLRMGDTMYNPPAALRHRIAATEHQPAFDRGMVRGEVHDENAWSLGGVAGHAGLFSTAGDLAVLAQTLLNGGRYGDQRILREDTVRAMLHNENAAFPEDSHGLGFELDQRWYMDALSSPVTFGHTGFTGTSLVVDPIADAFVVLLTNRVHPTRSWGSNNPSRRAVARALARSVAVRPVEGPTAWFSGMVDSRSATLTLPVDLPSGSSEARFGLWYDTEEGFDIAAFQMSRDGGQSWEQVPFTLRAGSTQETSDGTVSGFSGRHWYAATAPLRASDAGEVLLRWRYDTDGLYQGRGMYVDAVRVLGPQGVVFDDSRPGAVDRFTADGWTRSED